MLGRDFGTNLVILSRRWNTNTCPRPELVTWGCGKLPCTLLLQCRRALLGTLGDQRTSTWPAEEKMIPRIDQTMALMRQRKVCRGKVGREVRQYTLLWVIWQLQNFTLKLEEVYGDYGKSWETARWSFEASDNNLLSIQSTSTKSAELLSICWRFQWRR